MCPLSLRTAAHAGLLVWILCLLAGGPALAAGRAEEREALHARQFAQEGRHELVVGQCRQFRERFPSSRLSDLVLDLEGRAWLALGRPAEALGAFQTLVQLHSTSPLLPAAQLAAGRCLVRLDRTGEALLLWRRLAEQAPSAPEAVEALLEAEQHTPRGELAERENLLRLGAELDSESEAGLELRRRWALLLVEMGQADAARQMLERVLRESAPGPGHLSILLELERLLADNQQGEAAAALLTLNLPQYEDDPLRARLWLALAARRLELGRLEEAEHGLRQALEQEDAKLESPQLSDSLRLFLGDALSLMGMDVEAEQAWTTCAQQSPSVLMRRGLCLERLGQPRPAAQCLGAAAEALATSAQRTESQTRLLAAALCGLARTQQGLSDPILPWSRLGELSRLLEPDLPEATELAEHLLRGHLHEEALRLLDALRGDPLQADRRGMLRVELAVAREEWSQAGELAQIFHERWPLSPLRPVVDSLDLEVARPLARQAELARWLAELRQSSNERNPRALIEIGWLQLREMRLPEDALRTFAQAPPEAPEDLVAEARMGRLASLIELDRVDEARDEWEAGDRQLARSPWGLQALRTLWSVEPEPSAERRRERITLLENLRRAGRSDPQALAGELLDQWNGLREAIRLGGGSEAAQLDCARKALQWSDSLREPEPGRLLARSLCREAVGDKASASQDWQRLLGESPEDPAALVAARNLALEERADSLVRAVVLSQVESNWPWHPVAYQLQRDIATLERKAGRPAVSVAICERLLAQRTAQALPLPLPDQQDTRLLEELAQGYEALGRGEEARRMWLKTLRGQALKDPQAASRTLLGVSRSFQSAGRTEDASRFARTLTSTFPGSLEAAGAVRILATQESAAGRHLEALSLLEGLRPATSLDVGLRLQWVKALARTGSDEPSRDALQRLLKDFDGRVNEDTAKAAVGMARAQGLLERGQFAEAEKAFSLVAGKLDRTPQAPAAQLGAARSLRGLGKTAACLKALTALEKRWPRSPECAGSAALRAELAAAAGDTSLAMSMLERAHKLSPPHRAGEALAALVDGAGRLNRPLIQRRALEQYLAEYPADPDLPRRRLELALLLLEAGEVAGARAGLRALQAEADESRAAEIQFRLGEVAEREGDLQGAVLEYGKVPHLKDASALDWDAAALFASARCWVALERRPEALATLQQIVERHGENSGHGMRARQELEKLGGGQP